MYYCKFYIDCVVHYPPDTIQHKSYQIMFYPIQVFFFKSNKPIVHCRLIPDFVVMCD